MANKTPTAIEKAEIAIKRAHIRAHRKAIRGLASRYAGDVGFRRSVLANLGLVEGQADLAQRLRSQLAWQVNARAKGRWGYTQYRHHTVLACIGGALALAVPAPVFAIAAD